jgi:hypothetical protein
MCPLDNQHLGFRAMQVRGQRQLDRPHVGVRVGAPRTVQTKLRQALKAEIGNGQRLLTGKDQQRRQSAGLQRPGNGACLMASGLVPTTS